MRDRRKVLIEEEANARARGRAIRVGDLVGLMRVYFVIFTILSFYY